MFETTGPKEKITAETSLKKRKEKVDKKEDIFAEVIIKKEIEETVIAKGKKSKKEPKEEEPEDEVNNTKHKEVVKPEGNKEEKIHQLK